MEIIDFYASDNQDHWLSEIQKSDWRAGKYLYELLREQKLKELCGKSTKALLLVDDEKLLLIRLKEYKMFKEAGEKLKQQENIDRLYKAPDETCNDFRTILKQMNVENLINAFTKLLTKTNIEIAIEEPKTIERDRWTVEEKEFEIKTLLLKKESINFFEIVDESFTRGEIITTFMALLEMLKRQEIEVEQDKKYGDIIIVKGENING